MPGRSQEAFSGVSVGILDNAPGRADTSPVLDPVMGDNGKLYIPEDEVPEYKALLREADLILPNQFEAEWVTRTALAPERAVANVMGAGSYQTPQSPISSLSLLQSRYCTRPTKCHTSSLPLSV
jgi:pyridoxal/pyridoxine/pyridoxamine kinase